jgi:hypothetical protein
VDTENSVRIENAGFRSVREIIIVSKMSPFIRLPALKRLPRTTRGISSSADLVDRILGARHRRLCRSVFAGSNTQE